MTRRTPQPTPVQGCAECGAPVHSWRSHVLCRHCVRKLRRRDQRDPRVTSLREYRRERDGKCVVCGGPYPDGSGCEHCQPVDPRVPLSNGRGHALVSPQDIDEIKSFTWYLHSAGYAARKDQGDIVYMHRQIMGLEKGFPAEVDHINHETLDNRRENLRVVSHAINAANRKLDSRNKSGFRGVYLDERGKWHAQTAIGGKTRFLGRFDTPLEAAAAVAAANAEIVSLD